MRRIAALLLVSLYLLGAAACARRNDPGPGLSGVQAVVLIDKAPTSSLTLESVAEAFALGSSSTDVQRDMLREQLVGHSVRWTILVYEVSLEEGRFSISSQPIPITDKDAVALIRIVASITPVDPADDALLRRVKIGDSIHISGIVQDVHLRTIITMAPTALHRPDAT